MVSLYCLLVSKEDNHLFSVHNCANYFLRDDLGKQVEIFMLHLEMFRFCSHKHQNGGTAIVPFSKVPELL
uniref:Uncharacterized protein n=1 Tax=Anguilla anguilla TaxID=7936 RepID=A0A0E9XBZ8_ANGAN